MNQGTITNATMLLDALTELNPQVEFIPPIDNNFCVVFVITQDILALHLPQGFYFSQPELGTLKITNRYTINNPATPCVVILIREKFLPH